jgi:hypothetical protein
VLSAMVAACGGPERSFMTAGSTGELGHWVPACWRRISRKARSNTSIST